MTTTVDFVALQEGGAKLNVELYNQFAAQPQPSAVQGFAGIDKVLLAVSAQLRSAGRGTYGVTVVVEHSDDGASWSTMHSFPFSVTGSSSVSVDAPKDFVRARVSSVTGDWRVAVEAIPTTVNVPAGGGSLPDWWTIDDTAKSVVFDGVDGDGTAAVVKIVPPLALLDDFYIPFIIDKPGGGGDGQSYLFTVELDGGIFVITTGLGQGDPYLDFVGDTGAHTRYGTGFIQGAGTATHVIDWQTGGTDPLLGFFGTAAAGKPTGVAVTAAGVHAALVTLGLIAA